MPKRVKQHQLEDKSRAKYALGIPQSWVMRDKDKDYGIDIEVEIFDAQGRATGLVYWAQIKATESKNISRIKNIDLNIDTIKYFKQIDIPVLILRYSAEIDKFFFKWAHEIDLFYAKENAKTMRISFSEEDVWKDDTAEKIIGYLKKIRQIKTGHITLPISIYIEVKTEEVNAFLRGVLMSEFRRRLNNYPHLASFKRDPDQAPVFVTLCNKELKISLADVTGCTFHRIEHREKEGFAEGIIDDILLGIAASLISVGQAEMAARICLDEKLKYRFFKKQDLFINMIPVLINTSFYGEIIDTISEGIDSYDYELIQLTSICSSIPIVTSEDKEKYTKKLQLLNKCLEKSVDLGSSAQIGISHYNLGNFYRNTKQFQKSVLHYLRARRFEPKYLNQPYYYRELAGALFPLEKYKFAAKMYKQALDMGFHESIKPLYADALMFHGEYKSALQVFSNYLESTKDKHSEWHLKALCLENLIDHMGIEKQVRKKQEAINILTSLKTGDSPKIDEIRRAIEIDNLCGVAWFSLAIEQSKAGDFEDAAFSFILCGLVNPGNISTWVNATTYCFNKKFPIQILILVIQTAYFYNGDNYLAPLYKEISERLNGDELSQITNLIDELVPKNDSNNDLKIRILHEDGLFKDIFTGENE